MKQSTVKHCSNLLGMFEATAKQFEEDNKICSICEFYCGNEGIEFGRRFRETYGQCPYCRKYGKCELCQDDEIKKSSDEEMSVNIDSEKKEINDVILTDTDAKKKVPSKEIFVDVGIDKYEDFYMISNKGNCWSKKKRK